MKFMHIVGGLLGLYIGFAATNRMATTTVNGATLSHAALPHLKEEIQVEIAEHNDKISTLSNEKEETHQFIESNRTDNLQGTIEELNGDVKEKEAEIEKLNQELESESAQLEELTQKLNGLN